MVFQLLVMARWIHFGSVFVLFGSPLFWLYAEPVAPNAQDAAPRSLAATHGLLCVAAPAAVLSGFAWMAATLVNMISDGGGPDWSGLANIETLRPFFFETGFGAIWLLRLALLAAALYAVARWRRRASLRLLVGAGAALLITGAWLGHAAQGVGSVGAAMIAAYGVHVVAAAAWIGGLPPLLFVLAEQSAGTDPSPAKLAVLYRFSAMAMAAVATIIVSGAVNAGFRTGGSFGRLSDTAYGGVLCVKLALVAAMLALAWFNRFVATPRLRDAPAAGAAAAALSTSVLLELALGGLVLGAAAVLGLTPPPQ
jgi:putative copper resistance protein D